MTVQPTTEQNLKKLRKLTALTCQYIVFYEDKLLAKTTNI